MKQKQGVLHGWLPVMLKAASAFRSKKIQLLSENRSQKTEKAESNPGNREGTECSFLRTSEEWQRRKGEYSHRPWEVSAHTGTGHGGGAVSQSGACFLPCSAPLRPPPLRRTELHSPGFSGAAPRKGAIWFAGSS